MRASAAKIEHYARRIRYELNKDNPDTEKITTDVFSIRVERQQLLLGLA